MDYSNIPHELSQDIRDASLDETRFIFDDPHQPWGFRGRVCRDEDISVMEDFNYVGNPMHY